MGNSYAGQLKTTRFEEVLHNSIEASLRSNNLVPRPIFSQLYLEAEQQLSSLEAGSRVDNEEEEEEEEEESSESSSPPLSYQMKPPPEGCCTTDGFCQAGKDLRLVSISSDQIEVPSGFLLVGAKSPNLPDHLLVCAVDKRFLPDDNGRNALLGFSGNCVGCGKKGFCYFTEFSNHINLKLTTQPKKQKHLKYYLVRNAQGALTKGSVICWKGAEFRGRQASSGPCSSTLFQPPESSGPPLTTTSELVPAPNPNAPAGTQQTGTISDHLPSTAALGSTVYNGKDSPKQQLVKNNLPALTRPSVLGTLTNPGPPKKRHKGWSPESPSSTETWNLQPNLQTPNRNKNDVGGLSCLTHSTLVGPVSSPVVASGEPVSVPDNLLKICKAKPVIFKGHGNFPYLCGNLNDIIVSPLLYTCYRNSQSISRAYEQYGASTIQPISEEMQLLLTVYYLVQLAPDQVPLIEDLEQIFMRSWRESHLSEIRQYQQAIPQAFPPVPSQIAPMTSAQLPWLAGLAASSCNDSVHIIECSYSLAEGLSEMFKLLIEGKLVKTNYVVIICACRNRALDSCIAVTGKYQARVLSESMLTPAEYQKEVNYQLVTGKVETLGSFFSTLCPDGDTEVLLDKFYQENQGQRSSSLSTSVNKPTALDITGAAVCTSYNVERHQIRPFQLAVAQKLLSHVCSIADSSTQNLDLGSFEKVDFLICVPPSEVTYQQTLFHLWHSGVLLELGLEKEHLTKQRMEQYVVKLDAEAQTKFKVFLQNSMQNPHTLFVLIHDHAHWDLVSAVHSLYPQAEPSVGLVDRLLNCREVKEAPNILTLHVTSFPYALQTQHTHISPYNEIHWPSSYSNGIDLYHENKKYFGLSEFIESTLSGHSLPLLRYDSSFEAMVMALGKRFPRLHSAVIRTFVLVQHYSAAMMAVSGLSQMKNYTSVETLEITQNLVNSSRQCPSGHGFMVVLRIPCIPLAAVAYERLYHVRERLSLADNFEIILGNPNSGITIGKHFVEQLKIWQKIEDAEWRPQTYLELEGLPCILIFSGMDPQGEALPRSLRYCDLRLINSSCLVRTALEQELGLAAYFVSSEIHLEKVVVNDVLESDPEKLSSTDNEDEEIVTEGSTSEKRSPVKRERSCSHDSASSSLSSKASSAAFCIESSPPLATPGDVAKSPHQVLSSSTEENANNCERQRQKVEKGAQTVISKHLPAAAEQLDSKQNIKSAQISINSSSSPFSSSSSSSAPTHNSFILQASQCSMTKTSKQPPIVFLPKLVYDIITSTDSSGLPKSSSLLPYHSVMWASSFRPVMSKMMTCTEQSLYYRQWTVPKPIHMDYNNRNEGRMDTFHPRRLLLSGPPQIGKTGAYLQFLSILSRMLIRLTEVDVYDEEEINIKLQEEADQCYHQPADTWPDLETFKKIPFDYTIHDPKYEDASLICTRLQNLNSDDRSMGRKQEDMYMRRQTTRMRLSKYAAYNTYHHCEQCHQYMGFNPRYQLYESTLHAFAFSYSMLGEEIQLHFIIPKSKEHHFVFSQPGRQLESMRLPLVTDKSQDYIKSPTFTPTTGRHEHGLFNLYHAMDGASHLHVLVVKEYEMAIYKKYWPNHIMLVLPSIFNSAGVGAAHFLIKELSYHNLELERNRQEELGIKPQDIWPFIVISDDSCVMWNAVEIDCSGDRKSEYTWTERNVSLKQILQHIEATPNVTHYALIGMRKWSSKTNSGEIREPFSCCHVHDFIMLNVDLTQNVQYNQNRFMCDDVDFNLRAHSAGLLICRFNRFSVMKKQIAVGGHRSFHIKSKVSETPVSTAPAQYICAPDSKHTFLAAPAQLLLEKYLQYHSHRFFPLSLKNYSHPVLSVDCYLNLGPQIAVCYVSSRPHSLNISCSGLMFSGLLLYLCDSFVVASFLKKFHFLKGATLCVICQDRNSLRQTVVRLELEDEWQFRLRDEFQTANAKEDRPLFFLTGRHI
ncbi:protein GREB1 isoform X1 [Mauremys reevesii]|uniref:protein GREB1 isoform X1 n=1 Tax=Mauremys reevesii TaxID=260615 RepID=UPI00193F7D85|nr:protein GREB1 isoform X1 [Mauremys reevesii]XP_039385768.1 protein GREB1 isoform X1 [Mauremys reevesii]XP_039385769.1 protein GREB1 isoform X1 [Mauremys reevesii]XP_039385770.1 protein GREB1 isoform X1 [Mauremys reevesii]XP_039385771.1 protein GREB1 isoform X1 [Mauremys reevesii]